MQNKEKVLDFLNQIIERAEGEDYKHKAAALAANRASQAIGESWMVFHLKALKGLIEES